MSQWGPTKTFSAGGLASIRVVPHIACGMFKALPSPGDRIDFLALMHKEGKDAIAEALFERVRFQFRGMTLADWDREP
jgi:hypothetical protein